MQKFTHDVRDHSKSLRVTLFGNSYVIVKNMRLAVVMSGKKRLQRYFTKLTS